MKSADFQPAVSFASPSGEVPSISEAEGLKLHINYLIGRIKSFCKNLNSYRRGDHWSPAELSVVSAGCGHPALLYFSLHSGKGGALPKFFIFRLKNHSVFVN